MKYFYPVSRFYLSKFGDLTSKKLKIGPVLQGYSVKKQILKRLENKNILNELNWT